jgi:LmbE family N-acetylglucosaminyl deacetylase
VLGRSPWWQFGIVACPGFALVACVSSAGQRGNAEGDVLGREVRALLQGACTGAAVEAVPTWPRAPGPAPAPGPFEVVVYTAHPDDEAMYAGGTMDRLVRAGRRVAFVTMSHGEGGRLLERDGDGRVVERRDYPRAHVLEVRDREIADAARRIAVPFAHLYPGAAEVDFAWTTSCPETLAAWQRALPGGLEGMLRRVVADLRARRPRVVITLDPRDDPQASQHGHHKAVGVVVEAAARLAADPRVREGGAPLVIEELLTMAPHELPAGETVTVAVDVGARLRMLASYPSQFSPEQLAVDPIAQRAEERFVLRWRAAAAPAVHEGARLIDFVKGAPAIPPKPAP